MDEKEVKVWETFDRTQIEQIIQGNIRSADEKMGQMLDLFITSGYYLRRQYAEQQYKDAGYDLPEASMVVKVYFHRCFDYSSNAQRWEDRFHESWGGQEYYLVLDGKYFRDCKANRSELIDYLKEVQKNK